MKLCLLTFAVLLVACTSATPSQPSNEDASSPDVGVPDQPTAEQILSATWKRLPNAPTIAGKQDDVHFVGKDGFSINGLGEIYRSGDRGDTWEKIVNKPGTYFRAVMFLDDATRGFVANIGPGYYPGVTDSIPMYQTRDRGTTWEAVTTIDGPTPTGICNFNKVDDKHLVATGRVGGPSFFLSSSDSGQTWKSRDISKQLPMLVDSHFHTPLEGVITGASSTAASSKCSILRTEDGGESWTNVFLSKATGEMCWKLSFPTPNVGYAAVLTRGNTPSSFVKTTDGGRTWEELPFVDGPYAGLGVGFITEDIGWIGGEASDKPVYRTRDGGKTWEPDKSLGPYINRFRFAGNRTGYAIGTSIYRLDIP